MKQTNKNTTSAGLQTMEPKTVAAVILVAAMAVLWGRVLFRSHAGPAAAKAETAAAKSEEAQTQAIVVKPVHLSMVPGRNDAIAADCFRLDRCPLFHRAADPVKTDTNPDELLSRERLKKQQMMTDLNRAMSLEAVIRNSEGLPDKACINGAVISAGGTLAIPVGGRRCLLTVQSIETDRVVLTWEDQTLEIKMPEVESGLQER